MASFLVTMAFLRPTYMPPTTRTTKMKKASSAPSTIKATFIVTLHFALYQTRAVLSEANGLSLPAQAGITSVRLTMAALAFKTTSTAILDDCPAELVASQPTVEFLLCALDALEVHSKSGDCIHLLFR